MLPQVIGAVVRRHGHFDTAEAAKEAETVPRQRYPSVRADLPASAVASRPGIQFTGRLRSELRVVARARAASAPLVTKCSVK